MYKILIVSLLLPLLASCRGSPAASLTPGAGSQASPAPVTGIEGQVLIGPTCPVERLADPCPDQPYPATLRVLTLSGSQVLQFQTGPDGRFLIALDPGTYLLRPGSPAGKAYPSAREQTFTVIEGRLTQLTINYDSGIR